MNVYKNNITDIFDKERNAYIISNEDFEQLRKQKHKRKFINGKEILIILDTNNLIYHRFINENRNSKNRISQ